MARRFCFMFHCFSLCNLVQYSLQEGSYMVCYRPRITKEKGVSVMSDYEMIMIQLTILSLVVGLLLALIKKDK